MWGLGGKRGFPHGFVLHPWGTEVPAQPSDPPAARHRECVLSSTGWGEPLESLSKE